MQYKYVHTAGSVAVTNVHKKFIHKPTAPRQLLMLHAFWCLLITTIERCAQETYSVAKMFGLCTNMKPFNVMHSIVIKAWMSPHCTFLVHASSLG